MLRYKSLNQ